MTKRHKNHLPVVWKYNVVLIPTSSVIYDGIAIHIRNWNFFMKISKCYSSPARGRMHHIIYKHHIQFSQIRVPQRLSVKTGYLSLRHWILNRTFGHLAAQNSQQWPYHENELPNHGGPSRKQQEALPLGSPSDSFSMMTGQYFYGA